MSHGEKQWPLRPHHELEEGEEGNSVTRQETLTFCLSSALPVDCLRQELFLCHLGGLKVNRISAIGPVENIGKESQKRLRV